MELVAADEATATGAEQQDELGPLKPLKSKRSTPTHDKVKAAGMLTSLQMGSLSLSLGKRWHTHIHAHERVPVHTRAHPTHFR